MPGHRTTGPGILRIRDDDSDNDIGAITISHMVTVWFDSFTLFDTLFRSGFEASSTFNADDVEDRESRVDCRLEREFARAVDDPNHSIAVNRIRAGQARGAGVIQEETVDSHRVDRGQ